MCAIDNEPAVSAREAATFLLYLPDDESQELTLLFMHYLLRSRRQGVVYLGHKISLSDLEDATQPLRPDYVFTILQEPIPRHPIQGYLDSVARVVNPSQLLLTGAQLFVNLIKLPANARVLNGLQDTIQFLDNLTLKQRSNKTTSAVGDEQTAVGSAQ